MTAAVKAVGRFGTGLTTTRTFPVDGGWCWQRSVGPLAPEPFAPAAGSTVEGTVRLVRGEGDERSRSYVVRGSESVAAVLLWDGPDESLLPVMRGLGEALRRLHSAPAPQRPSTALKRLGDWLDGRARQLWAAQAAGYLRDGLGEQRWRTLRAWHAEAVAGSGQAHGAASLGLLVLAPDRASADLLTGEDECVGAPALDLGWVVGEIVEMSAGSARPPDAWQRLLSALADGYGTEIDAACHRVAALRLALHLHDLCAYVGWSESEFERYHRLLTLLVPA